MTTRQFDPVFSAALRNELESLAETREAPAPKGLLASLQKPQVWISIVTAVVLVTATIGVLQVAHPTTSEPAGRSRVVDPLAQITDPSNGDYVARLVQTLLAVRDTGPGAHDFEVPAGAKSVRTYIDCAPSRAFATEIDRGGRSSGRCGRTLTSYYDMPISAGKHTLTITVPKGTEYSALVIVSPAPTVATGALIDPLAEVRDLRNPDALTGDTTPVLRVTDTAVGGTGPIAVTPGRRLRIYFVCAPSATAEVVVDGHHVTGCMNSIAHWFDFTPSVPRIDWNEIADPATRWSLLVVPAPKGAKDSPADTTLAYPTVRGPVLARARGAGAPASGTYRNPGRSMLLSVTCRGTGWVEIETTDGGTNTRGNACSTSAAITIGFMGDRDGSLRRWSVVPHGDISWTFQMTDDD